jgi:microfibrillar-associated protein 1
MFEMEKAETLRRRNLTEEERQREDQHLHKDTNGKEKPKWNFMQKYYHKGVFYMDEDSLQRDDHDVRKQEFNEPTLEDRVDKEKLPTVMQVKKFGMRGRTKYTHLVDQDTTRFDKDARPDKRVQESYQRKVGGVGDIDSAGRYKKSRPN